MLTKHLISHKDMENHVKDKEQGCMSPYLSWLAYLQMDYNATVYIPPKLITTYHSMLTT